MRSGFAIITTDNRLQIYSGDPEQIEPRSFQFSRSLDYQYSYTKNGLLFLRFLNKPQSRVEDYEIELPTKVTRYFTVDKNIDKIYGTENTILARTESGVLVYAHERYRGTYFFFSDETKPNLTSVFITPGNSLENDTYVPGSDGFDPYTNFRIKQNRDERNFSTDDIAKTRR
jgi:hypothetical protein